jgi:hypothetical protein
MEAHPVGKTLRFMGLARLGRLCELGFRSNFFRKQRENPTSSDSDIPRQTAHVLNRQLRTGHGGLDVGRTYDQDTGRDRSN